MILTKDGREVAPTNPHTIAAFISEGWTVKEQTEPEPEQAPAEAPKKTTRKKKATTKS